MTRPQRNGEINMIEWNKRGGLVCRAFGHKARKTGLEPIPGAVVMVARLVAAPEYQDIWTCDRCGAKGTKRGIAIFGQGFGVTRDEALAILHPDKGKPTT